MPGVLLDCTLLGKDGKIVAVDWTSSFACNTGRAGYGLQDAMHLECRASSYMYKRLRYGMHEHLRHQLVICSTTVVAPRWCACLQVTRLCAI